MEQRREPRLAINRSVAVTVLGGKPQQFTATVKNASGRGLALQTSEAIPPGSALKIDIDDAIVLAEAVYCHSGDGGHLVGVELDQVLCGLAELGKRLQEFAELDGLNASGGCDSPERETVLVKRNRRRSSR